MENPIIITKRNVDGQGNPVSIKLMETRQIFQTGAFIVLKQVPDEYYGVQIQGYKEIFDIEKMKNHEFKVDYAQGVIYFHPKAVGKTVVIDYYGTGYDLISCSRIFTKYDKYGNVVETLEEVLDKIYEVEPIINRLTKSEELIDQIHVDLEDAKELQPLLHNDVIQGRQTKEELEQTISSAQDDINTIKATGNDVKYITKNQWVLNSTSGMYEYTLPHTMNSKALTINCYYTDTDEFAFIGGKIVDKNNILFKNEEAVNLTCIISSRYYKAQVTLTSEIAEEVVEARKGKVDLKTKIDEIDNGLVKVNEDLDNIMIEKANESEVRKKSILIEDYDLGQSVKELLTNGNVAVVGERCINKINVNNNAITLNQTDFIKQGNINLCLFTTFESGYINATNGNLMGPSSEYKSTGFIEVSALNNYSCNENLNIAFYNNSKTFVSGKSGGTWSSPLTIPNNVSYIRLTYSATNDNPIFNLGDKIYTKEEATITDSALETLLKKQIYSKMLTYDVTSLNLYNPTTDSADNTAISATTGKQITLSGYKATGFIEVIEGLNVCISEQNNLAFYDENKIFVSGKNGGWTNPLTIPKGVKYLRHTFSLTAQNKQISYGNKLSEYSLYGEKFNILFKDDFLDSLKQQLNYGSKLKNKIWNALGDSVTYGLGTTKTYHKIISDRTGINVNNYGLSTSTIAVNGWTGVQSFVERYLTMNKSADYITVFGGFNDFIHKTPLGSFDSRDNTTFYGALHELCQGLYNNFTTSKIMFITPYINEGAKTPRALDGKTLIDFVNVIEEVCGYYGIKVKNLYKESGIDCNISIHKTTFAPDGLHLNIIGHERISNSIESDLESL